MDDQATTDLEKQRRRRRLERMLEARSQGRKIFGMPIGSLLRPDAVENAIEALEIQAKINAQVQAELAKLPDASKLIPDVWWNLHQAVVWLVGGEYTEVAKYKDLPKCNHQHLLALDLTITRQFCREPVQFGYVEVAYGQRVISDVRGGDHSLLFRSARDAMEALIKAATSEQITIWGRPNNVGDPQAIPPVAMQGATIYYFGPFAPFLGQRVDYDFATQWARLAFRVEEIRRLRAELLRRRAANLERSEGEQLLDQDRERQCHDWFKCMMIDNQPPPLDLQTKELQIREAILQFRISRRAVIRERDQAISETGNLAWKRAGRKSTRESIHKS